MSGTADVPLPSAEPLLGIFVGGKASRMNRPKGLLRAPDGSGRTLVARLLDEIRAALPRAPVTLVGRGVETEHFDLPVVSDSEIDCGPLGGLVGLLDYAAKQRRRAVIALSCDLPYLRRDLIASLASDKSGAEVVCPMSEGKFQPLIARYQTECRGVFREALLDRKLSLQRLFTNLDVHVLNLSEVQLQQTQDWDRPEDLPGGDPYI